MVDPNDPLSPGSFVEHDCPRWSSERTGVADCRGACGCLIDNHGARARDSNAARALVYGGWFTGAVVAAAVSVVELDTEAVFEIEPKAGRDATVAVILMVTDPPRRNGSEVQWGGPCRRRSASERRCAVGAVRGVRERHWERVRDRHRLGIGRAAVGDHDGVGQGSTAMTGSGLSLLVIDRSASGLTVVVVVALSLAGSGRSSRWSRSGACWSGSCRGRARVDLDHQGEGRARARRQVGPGAADRAGRADGRRGARPPAGVVSETKVVPVGQGVGEGEPVWASDGPLLVTVDRVGQVVAGDDRVGAVALGDRQVGLGVDRGRLGGAVVGGVGSVVLLALTLAVLVRSVPSAARASTLTTSVAGRPRRSRARPVPRCR